MIDTRLKILCVDGDGSVARHVAAFAAERVLGWEVVSVHGAQDAWRAAAQRRCDLVITTYRLVDGTALDLVQGSSVPVVVTTAVADVDVAVACMREGAADFLVRDAGGAYLERLPGIVLRALDARRNEQLFRMLFHSIMCIREALFVTDMDDVVTFVNAAFRRTFGYAEREIIGTSARVLWEVEGVIEESPPPTAARIAEGGSWSGDVLNRRQDGTIFPVSMSRSVVRDDAGRDVAVVGVVYDNTARRRHEEQIKASLKEKEVLLKEIHHRVKNNLQVISSLLNLQSAYVTDERTLDVLRDSQNRVKSMALIHERLYQTRALTKIDFGDYLFSLVSHIKSSFRGVGDVDVRIDADGYVLDVDLVIPCGLIVNELISNSLKHGFPDGRSGEIVVALRHGQDFDLVLTVADDGCGLPADLDLAAPRSLGLQLVTMLTQQVRGELRVERDRGTAFIITFPME
ncbi:MAG: PAS domain S-box protein [Desulfovibrionaceae bacterium]|jgi:PAS domain S-box-containing protein|nr:PAS domain S-box protein [Desulfovibrionaceae bacterium]